MRKIIGTFRSENGAEYYQYIASVFATWRLQGKDVHDELKKLLVNKLCLKRVKQIPKFQIHRRLSNHNCPNHYLFKQQGKENYMEKIPGWVEKIFAPKVNELIGEVRGLNTKVDGLRNEMLARFEATDIKIDSLKNETKADIEGLRKETKSDIESLGKEIRDLREATTSDIEGLRKETKIHIETLEKVMISKFVAVDARFDSLEAKIPVVEKLAKFEVRLAELEKKVSVHA